MKLNHSLLVIGLSTALCSVQASAADYFVQAMTPGPVQGTVLQPVSLQATTDTATPPVGSREWYKLRWKRRQAAADTDGGTTTTTTTTTPAGSPTTTAAGISPVAAPSSAGTAGPSSGATAGAAGSLASTGADSRSVALIGTGLVLLGMATVLSRRRRVARMR